MTQTLFATYDGKQNLLIEKPLHLPPNTKVKIIVEVKEEITGEKKVSLIMMKILSNGINLRF